MKSQLLLISIVLLFCETQSVGAATDDAIDFLPDVQPLLAKYCYSCHGSDEPSAQLDLTKLRTQQEVDQAFETWRKAVELLKANKMPPGDEPMRPSTAERSLITQWYQSRFIDNVLPQPGPLQPRRLSAREYKHTLESLFGFELLVNVLSAEETLTERSLVMKLVPTDPKGGSGYRNDTHANPLTTVAWDRYSQIVDSAILELFSARQRNNLERSAGPIPESGFNASNAERLLKSFMPRAVRRYVPEARIQAAVARVKKSDSLLNELQFELKSILMSPDFLYRGLHAEGTPGSQQPVDDFELAERLSYFLWADMPDDQLMAVAAQGKLGNAHHLRTQTERLLRSPKAKNLANDWAVQWLSLSEIDEVSNNVPVVEALKDQAIDFVQYIIQEDRPILEIIDSDVEFVNTFTEGLYAADKKQFAKYVKPQGIEAEIVPNQKIKLEKTVGRGGLLTMPGLLAMNRGPIIRGTWILEKILGESLPDPPPDVGQVQPNKPGEQLTFRQRFEQHRNQVACGLCHDKIDPLGFALESYDIHGAFLLAEDYPSQRIKKLRAPKNMQLQDSSATIDTAGQLPSGETFADVEALKQILTTTQRSAVIRNVVVQLLSYALCRKLEFYDQPTVDAITRRMVESEGSFQQLIHEIVHSLPFRQATFSGVNP